MLTANVDVSDGLVNGARGEVVHVVTNNSDDVTSVLFKFDLASNLSKQALTELDLLILNL